MPTEGSCFCRRYLLHYSWLCTLARLPVRNGIIRDRAENNAPSWALCGRSTGRRPPESGTGKTHICTKYETCRNTSSAWLSWNHFQIFTSKSPFHHVDDPITSARQRVLPRPSCCAFQPLPLATTHLPPHSLANSIAAALCSMPRNAPAPSRRLSMAQNRNSQVAQINVSELRGWFPKELRKWICDSRGMFVNRLRISWLGWTKTRQVSPAGLGDCRVVRYQRVQLANAWQHRVCKFTSLRSFLHADCTCVCNSASLTCQCPVSRVHGYRDSRIILATRTVHVCDEASVGLCCTLESATRNASKSTLANKN